MRPDAISVTEVPELLADPYGFYAKRVLRLRALDPLDADVGALGLRHHRACRAGALRHPNLPRPGGWPGEDAAAAIWDGAAEEALEAQGPRPRSPPSGARGCGASAPSSSPRRRGCARAARSPPPTPNARASWC
jgi:hypothetical protein